MAPRTPNGGAKASGRSTRRIATRKFARDERGGIIIFGLLLFIPMLAFIGFAWDIIRFEMQRASLQYNLDNAVLAAADLDQTADPADVVLNYLDVAGLADYIEAEDIVPTVTINSKTVYASAEKPLSSLFTGTAFELADLSGLKVPAASEARESIEDVEISLVLDVSGSMRGSRLADLQDAASDFVDEIVQNTTDGKMSMSIVPYSTQVSVPKTLMDNIPNTNEHDYSYCMTFDADDFLDAGLDVSGQTQYKRMYMFDHNNYSDDNWRYYDGRYNDPDSLVRDDNCDNDPARRVLPMQKDATILKNHINGLYADGWTSIDLGVKWGTALLDSSTSGPVAALVADGSVPSEFDGRPAVYSNNDVVKVMVVMTDGENTNQYYIRDKYRTSSTGVYWHEGDEIYTQYHDNRDDPDSDTDTPFAYYEDDFEDHYDDRMKVDGSRWHNTPYVGKDGEDSVELSFAELVAKAPLDLIADRFKYSMNSASRRNMYSTVGYNDKDDRTLDICDSAKAEGIIIYSIAFNAPQAAQDLLRACASSDAQYFDVSGLEIQNAFKAIADSISKLRLTQ